MLRGRGKDKATLKEKEKENRGLIRREKELTEMWREKKYSPCDAACMEDPFESDVSAAP